MFGLVLDLEVLMLLRYVLEVIREGERLIISRPGICACYVFLTKSGPGDSAIGRV